MERYRLDNKLLFEDKLPDEIANKELQEGEPEIITPFDVEIPVSIEEIINDLPEMLKTPCNYLVDEVEKEVFFIGALGVISGMLPNVTGLYSGKWINANLYVYVLAGYGGGKGGLDFARELGKPVHKDKREQAKFLVSEYLKEVEVYKKKLKVFNKDKSPQAQPPEKPTPPPSLMLFIPANNSKSGIYQLLSENGGKGIIFESEGDTLADAIKQDYGNFSDTLRKGFHHESLDLFRRANNEHIEIEHPEISVILSSTFDQLKILIPGIENGLYSRFLFYELKQNNSFVNVFDHRKKDYKDKFSLSGEEFKNLYNELNKRDEPVYFHLTPDQEKKLVNLFDEKKKKLINEIDEKIAGTINRLGVIAYRVMMLLTVLRRYKEGALTQNIYCTDVDFNNALKIVQKLETHALNVYEYLNGGIENKTLAIDLKERGKSYGEISKTIFGDDRHKGTIYKWVNNKKYTGNGGNG